MPIPVQRSSKLQQLLDWSEHRGESLGQIRIRLGKEENDVTSVLRQHRDRAREEREHVTLEERVYVLSVQPNDEVVDVFIIRQRLL